MSAIEIPGYKIIKTLGVGGQATVYLAIQQGFDREVALKVMSPALAADPTFGERFIREAKIVAKLSHARIVTVYDVGESGNFYYLAMEYMRGEELKTQISKGIKAKQALVIIAKLAQALHFAHKKGYIHRDVKSENILFDDDKQPVLTDFGIAKASNSSTQMTQTGKLIGTPEYMSPEQCRGKKLDGRSDLYSLGIILFEMMTRKVPFTGDDSVSVCIQHVTKPIPKLPARHARFQWLIDSLLAKNPKDRFQTAQDLANAIKKFLTSGEMADIKVSKTTTNSISQVMEQSSQPDEFENDQFENDQFINENYGTNDNFEVDQRINVQPETKSRVALITTSFLLILAVGVGYMSRNSWLPNVQKILGVEWAQTTDTSNSHDRKISSNNEEKLSSKKNIADINSNQPVKNVTENLKKVENTTNRVEVLIQQASTLAQYSPHELTDIQQALDNLTTAKSLDPNNKNLSNIKSNIINIALQESVLSAKQKLFDNANQWLSLVESADHDNSRLFETKQQIALLKQSHDTALSEQEKQTDEVNKYIQLAEKSLSDNRLSAPNKDNAIYYYQSALKLAPDDIRIKNGLKEIEIKFIALINQAVNKNKHAQARGYLQKLKNIPLNNNNFNEIENNISQSRQKYNIQQKEKKRLADIAARKAQQIKDRETKLADPLVQMRLQSNLQTAVDLVNAGHLVEPSGNNALEKFQAALVIDPIDQSALDGVKSIEQTIITNIDLATANQIAQTAELWIAKLRLFNAEHPKLNDYQLQLDELKLNSDLEQQTNSSEAELGSNLMDTLDSSDDSSLENSEIESETESDDLESKSESPTNLEQEAEAKPEPVTTPPIN